MTPVDVEVVKPLEVAVSSVNTPDGPNDVALVPVIVNPNEPPNPAAVVSLVILRDAVAESTNVHSTVSFGETVTVTEFVPVVADIALPEHVTPARLHPVGIVLSVIM